MLVREQLICSTQVHVDVDDRDLAIAVGRRVAPWLPALLALSASSPFWLGTDTGYASYRTLIWRRWPTAGALPGFGSAAEYDRAVADLVRSGVILDPGMIYFDVRPSAHLPTLELRICDSCPSLEDVVLLAGLFRALVIREIEAEHAGLPPVPVRPGLLEAATWRAAQAGLQGDLVDPVTAGPVPAWLHRAAAGRVAARAGVDRRLGACERARQVGPGPGRLSGTPARRPRQRRPAPRRRHAHRRNPRRPAMAAERTAGRVTPGAPMSYPVTSENTAAETQAKGCIAPGRFTLPGPPEPVPASAAPGLHRAGTARTERNCHEPLSRHRTTAACRRTDLLDLR